MEWYIILIVLRPLNVALCSWQNPGLTHQVQVFSSNLDPFSHPLRDSKLVEKNHIQQAFGFYLPTYLRGTKIEKLNISRKSKENNEVFFYPLFPITNLWEAPKGAFMNYVTQIWTIFNPLHPSVMHFCPRPYALLSQKALSLPPSLCDVIFEWLLTRCGANLTSNLYA